MPSVNRLYPATKLHLSGFRFRDDSVMERADTLVDNNGHGIIPAGNRRTLPEIQLMLQLCVCVCVCVCPGGGFWGSSMWLSTQQVDYLSYIMHSPNT